MILASFSKGVILGLQRKGTSISIRLKGFISDGSKTFPSEDAPRKGWEGFTTRPASYTVNFLVSFYIACAYRDLAVDSFVFPCLMEETFDKSLGSNKFLKKALLGCL